MQEESTTGLCNSSYPKLMCNVTDIYDSQVTIGTEVYHSHRRLAALSSITYIFECRIHKAEPKNNTLNHSVV